MADVILSAELQAKVDSFVKNLLDAANTADNTGASVTKMSASISSNIANVNKVNLAGFTASLKAGQISIKAFSDSAAKLPTALPKITVGSNQAAFALQNLGRVAQDAPFGFIGIQNNLNPLLESFQRLRLETGSNSAAFKALGQSLLGPAGIGIALSVVSSAILLYQQYQQRANKATENAKKVTDDYIKSLDEVRAAQLKGSQNAQKELTDLSLLYSAYQNANLPLKARQNAYKQLQEQYPAYFGNLKFEEKASLNTANAYTLLTQEILASARARAAAEKISANEGRKLEGEQKLIDLSRDRVKLLREQDALQAKVDAGIGSAERGDSSGAQDAIDLLRTNKQVEQNLKSINDLVTDRNLLDQQNGRLVGYVNTQIEKGAKLTGGFGDAVKKVKEELTKTNTNTLGGLLGIDSLDAGAKEVTIKPKLKIEPIILGFSELQAEADKWNERFASTIQGGFANTLSTIGDSIGAALQSGADVVDAIGSSILSGFGSFLSQFGDLLIEYGAAAILKSQLDLAIAIPGAGIAAGFAAVAAGLALKIAAGAIGSFIGGRGKGGGVTAFANGGIISGPTLGLMGEYAGAKSDPEVVAPLSKLKAMLGQTDSSGNVLPNSNQTPVYVQQELSIDGKKLVALIRTVQDSNKRVG